MFWEIYSTESTNRLVQKNNDYSDGLNTSGCAMYGDTIKSHKCTRTQLLVFLANTLVQ